ncbi:guanylate-binding protein 2-like [Macrotis lagotis]|uniref:guanylate-binding protein 2-like n=1 Tax=Macrotis lagotis TaxID=92651 RepID=UPI003D69FD2F
MASGVQMSAPVCLIENSKGQMMVNEEAQDILSSITNPVVVVATVGLYRTGKSYLMNRLAGEKSGFSIGSTVQSQTKGIWMWCVPHPKEPNYTLVLLDTEGLGDMEKGDNKNDTWIFALAVLLSSTFVYNSMGTINQQAMEQLHFVTELSEHIKSKSASNTEEVENSSEFVSFFPDFVWVVRDFTLELEIDGKPVTSDEYLEAALKLKQGESEKVKKFNLPRHCIRQFFPKKKCFVFNQPVYRKKLSQLAKLADSELDAEFVEQSQSFCSYIFQHSNVKTLQGGVTVNGPRLKNLVLTYVKTITSGDVPCMENALLTLAETENTAAVQRALTYYEDVMKQRVRFPTETLKEFLDAHATCEKKAIEVFMKESFKDDDRKFQMELGKQVEAKKEAFYKQNLEESTKRCRALLEDIFGPLEEDVNKGIFSKPGGYYSFMKNMDELKQKYYKQSSKGIQAEETLQEYLKSKKGTAEAILQADMTLSKQEKEREVERVKAQAAEAAAKQLEEGQKKDKELMEQKEKSYQEHLKQMEEKMELERKLIRAEQEKVMFLKLKEQEELLKEGFTREAMGLQKQIDVMKDKINECKKEKSTCIIL